MDHPVCKHFQTGYCKFGEHCRKRHNKEGYTSSNCFPDLCTMRHVKICRYFNILSTCKFGNSCAFKQDIIQNQSDIQELKNQIAELSLAVNKMSMKITGLEDELKSSNESSKISVEYSCDYCEFTSKTIHLSKENITLNHIKVTTSTPKK